MKVLPKFSVRERLLADVAALNLPAKPAPVETVREDEIAGLPLPAQRYMRYMGVVGRPRDWSFRICFRGEFRLNEGSPWTTCEAWQYNTSHPVMRIFDMRINIAKILPLFGTDIYLGGHGRMRGKLLGIVPVVNGSGRELDLGELVTYLNDACLIAPSMLLDPAVMWRAGDDDTFELTLTDGGSSVTAQIRVDKEGRLVEFGTTDRWYTGPSGLVRTSWTTPVQGWAIYDGRPFLTALSAIWHPAGRDFEYIRGRFVPETAEFNVPSRIDTGAEPAAA
ncbi:MAG TPA: DUF6544 family protein [Jiangellaceae bacterium]|nr:DUF6544 family protein [Jiangellaceae bacterium]